MSSWRFALRAKLPYEIAEILETVRRLRGASRRMGGRRGELLVVCAARETTLRREIAEIVETVGRLRGASRRMGERRVELVVVCAARETTLRREIAEILETRSAASRSKPPDG